MRRILLLPLAALGLSLAACSSGTPAANTTTTTHSSSPPSTASTSTTSTAGGAAAGNVPDVEDATDLSVAPTVKPGTPPPPTTLQTKDLVQGTGATAKAGDTVKVQYVGAHFATGAPFDSSWSRGQPATFPLNNVIPGFAQGIEGMQVGGRREIVIPGHLGYGASPPPGSGIAPNETLVFVVDLLGIS
jgi:peptidylprolyl isomerase